MATVVERVDTLEEVVKNFVRDVGIEFNKVYNAQLRMEMELQTLKEDTQAFKDEMRAFKDEMRAQSRDMNRRWGELANKMGTLVEDIVAPSMPRVARELFGCEILGFFAVRVKRALGRQVREYDALLACNDYVLVNETKSTLQASHVDGIANSLEEFREVFPEYRDRKLIGIVASLYVDESVVRYASAKGILALAMGDEAMTVLNPEAAKPY